MEFYRRCSAVLFVVCLFSFAGCVQPFRSVKSFGKTGKDYVRCLRWMEYHGAAKFMDEKVRSDFFERLESLGEIQIVDARLEEVDYRSGEEEGYTTVLLTYYRLPSATVREVRMRQKWVFRGVELSTGGEWMVETLFPPFP